MNLECPITYQSVVDGMGSDFLRTYDIQSIGRAGAPEHPEEIMRWPALQHTTKISHLYRHLIIAHYLGGHGVPPQKCDCLDFS